MINGGIKMTDITDGTSNTVMINEVRVGLNDKDRRGAWADCVWALINTREFILNH